MMARPSIVLVLALLLVLAGGSSASGGEAPPAPPATGASPPPAASFDAANRLYEQQKYVEAARAFEALLRQQPTAAVWFNLGNARLQSGEVGRAIAAYRHARRLEPRAADVSANLATARARVGLPGPALDFLQRWLSPDGWALLALATVFGWLGVQAAREVSPAFRRTTGGLVKTLGLAAVLGVAAAALVAWSVRGAHAVVTRADAPARFGPVEESQVAFTLPDGAEVRVLAQRPGWLQVRDRAGRAGWVAEEAAVKAP